MNNDTTYLKQILQERGITQYRLAKDCEITQSTIIRICQGKTAIGTLRSESLYRIAKYLDIPMETLIEKQEEGNAYE